MDKWYSDLDLDLPWWFHWRVALSVLGLVGSIIGLISVIFF
jgi:hypothetical protein